MGLALLAIPFLGIAFLLAGADLQPFSLNVSI
jgi:hypothetical protein